MRTARLVAATGLFLASPLLAWPAFAQAQTQGKPLACMVEASGGLSWKEGQWSVTGFKEQDSWRFVLVLRGNSLDPQSVEKPIRGSAPVCRIVALGAISCEDRLGGYLYFDPQTNRGTVAQLLGGTTSPSPTRDTLSVAPFSCQPF